LFEILEAVRRRFPEKPIALTTNGSLLDEKAAYRLAGLMPVEVTLSLNSSNPSIRRAVMGIRGPDLGPSAVRHLEDAGVPFHGSIVAVPQAGIEDLEETILFLESQGAMTVRVFLPGFTCLAASSAAVSPGWEEEVRRRVLRLTERREQGSRTYPPVPITVEPPSLSGLDPVVEGVIRDGPAARAGLRAGDMVSAVNGTKPRSRVDAFRMLKQAEDPEVHLIRRGGRGSSVPISLRLRKGAGESPGAVMYRDLDMSQVEEAERAVRRARAKRPLFVTSELACRVVRAGLASIERSWESRVVVARNRFFGGTIACAGLLTVSDMLEALRERDDPDADLVVVPSAAFDRRGTDLTGRSYMDISIAFGGVGIELV